MSSSEENIAMEKCSRLAVQNGVKGPLGLGRIGHCEQFGHCGHYSGHCGQGQLLSLPIANSSSLVMTVVVVRMNITMLII